MLPCLIKQSTEHTLPPPSYCTHSPEDTGSPHTKSTALSLAWYLKKQIFVCGVNRLRYCPCYLLSHEAADTTAVHTMAYS